MTEIYNVTICQDMPITRIEGEGKKAISVVKGVEHTVIDYKGCTWAQVQFYRKTYPGAEITIEQTGGFKSERDKRPRASFGKREAAAAPKRERPAPVKEPTYEHGSYADVINNAFNEGK